VATDWSVFSSIMRLALTISCSLSTSRKDRQTKGLAWFASYKDLQIQRPGSGFSTKHRFENSRPDPVAAPKGAGALYE
jgi:hypothetical protein